MSDNSEIEVEGVRYISSRRAAETTGYAQDYIGQLARSSQILAKRVGGLWYISPDSLAEYKKLADAYVPQPPQKLKAGESTDSLVAFDGKDYLSAARAAELTGYHQDYVGQLAREGTVLAKQVGNRWYVERENILAHKKNKDSLLAAVQAESVGIYRPAPVAAAKAAPQNTAAAFYTYTADKGDLMPFAKAPEMIEPPPVEEHQEKDIDNVIVEEHVIPIKVRNVPSEPIRSPVVLRPALVAQKMPQRERSMVSRPLAMIGAVATVVIFLSVGFVSLKKSSIYAQNATLKGGSEALAASAAEAFETLGAFLEETIVPELVYRRSN